MTPLREPLTWFMVVTTAFTLLPDYTALVAISGAFGGAIRWSKLRLSFLPGLLAILNGAIVAVFLWPFAQPIIANLGLVLELTVIQQYMTGGFLIGFLADVLLTLLIVNQNRFLSKPK